MLKIRMLLLAMVMLSLTVPPAFSGDIGKVPFNRRPKTNPGVLARCDDGLPCTEDRMVNGQCTHVVKPGFCLIDGVCYSRRQRNPQNECQECRDEWGSAYQKRWGFDNSNACSDKNPCTEGDHCSSGNCVGRLKPDCK